MAPQNQMKTSTTAKVTRASIRTKLTDTEFFTKNHYSFWLLQLARGFLVKVDVLTRGVVVKTVNNSTRSAPSTDPAKTLTGCTDGKTIYINVNSARNGNPYLQKKAKDEASQNIVGTLTHELGHIWLSNFVYTSDCIVRIASGKGSSVMPAPIDGLSANMALRDILKDYAQGAANYLATLNNIMEDGRIEERLVARKDGILTTSLRCHRDAKWKESIPLEELGHLLDSGEIDEWFACSSAILTYSLFGSFKRLTADGLKLPFMRNVKKCLRYVDAFMDSPSAQDRMANAISVLVLLWPLILPNVEKAPPEMGTPAPRGMPPSSAASRSELTSSSSGKTRRKATREELEKATTATKSETTPSESEEKEKPESEEGKGSCESEGKEEPESEEGKGSSGSEGREEPESEEGKGSCESEGKEEPESKKGKEDDGSGEEEKVEPLESSSDDPGEENGDEPGASYNPEEKGEAIDTYDGIKGRLAKEFEETEDDYKSSVEALESLLEKTVDDLEEEAEDMAMCGQAQYAADHVKMPRIHDGIQIKVSRIKTPSEDAVEEYKQLEQKIRPVITKTIKGLESILKERQKGGKKSGQLLGRRLDSRQVYRDDGKVFYTKKLPQGKPETVFFGLFDESGSMSCSSRIQNAKLTALVLCEVFYRLQTPFAIYGHTTYDSAIGEGCLLNAYSDFGKTQISDKYRIMSMSAQRNNRDGCAIRYAMERLKERPEQTKVLVLVCDGEPAANGYYGDAAKADLQYLQKELKANRIAFLVTGIGGDQERLTKIYGKNYMHIPDVSKLPLILPRKLLPFLHI